MAWTPAYQQAIDGTLPIASGSAITYPITITNNLTVPIMMYAVSASNEHVGWNTSGKLTAGFPPALIGANGGTTNLTLWTPGMYLLFQTAYSGAFVTVLQLPSVQPTKPGNLIYPVSTDLLTAANNIGSVPTPTTAVIIPPDSPRILIASGKTPKGTPITREQYWRRTPDSYTLAPNETKTFSTTLVSGMEETSSSDTTMAQSLGVSASGGWGPISASVSASLSKTTSTFQQLTFTSNTTSYSSSEIPNPDTENPTMYLMWQLTDVITIFDTAGLPLSSVVTGNSPLVVSGPWNLNQLPSPSTSSSTDDTSDAVTRTALTAAAGSDQQVVLAQLDPNGLTLAAHIGE